MEEASAAAEPRPLRIVELSIGRSAWGLFLAALLGALVGVAADRALDGRDTTDAAQQGEEILQAMRLSAESAAQFGGSNLRTAAEVGVLLDQLRRQREHLRSSDAKAVLTPDVIDLVTLQDALKKAQLAEDSRRRFEAQAAAEPARSDAQRAADLQRLAGVFASSAALERRRAQTAVYRIRSRAPQINSAPMQLRREGDSSQADAAQLSQELRTGLSRAAASAPPAGSAAAPAASAASR